MRIADALIEANLFNDATFASFSLEGNPFAHAIGAYDMHANFTGSIASQNGTVLAQNRLRSAASCSKGAADPCGSASRDQYVAA